MFTKKFSTRAAASTAVMAFSAALLGGCAGTDAESTPRPADRPTVWLDSDHPVYPSVDAVGESADTVVIGRLIGTSVDPGTSPGLAADGSSLPPIPRTLYRIRVIEVVKGDVAVDDEIVVPVLGGDAGSTTLQLTDGVEVVSGTDYLYFLKSAGGMLFPLAGNAIAARADAGGFKLLPGTTGLDEALVVTDAQLDELATGTGPTPTPTPVPTTAPPPAPGPSPSTSPSPSPTPTSSPSPSPTPAPAVPTLSTPDRVVGVSTVTIAGVAQPGALVNLLRGKPGRPLTPSATATADAQGNYSFERRISRTTQWQVTSNDVGSPIRATQVQIGATLQATRRTRHSADAIVTLNPALRNRTVRVYLVTEDGTHELARARTGRGAKGVKSPSLFQPFRRDQGSSSWRRSRAGTGWCQVGATR